jgi:hypothetical protein
VKAAPVPTPKPVKVKAVKAEDTFVAPTTEAVVVRTDEDKFPEKIKCAVCDRRIRVGQTMFTRDGEGWFHAVEADCIAKPAVHRASHDAPSDAPPVTSAAVAPIPKAEPGTLLEAMEKAASASVPETGTIVPSEGTIDLPPATQPLETTPSVDAPATPRKRLTFLEDDQEIM